MISLLDGPKFEFVGATFMLPYRYFNYDEGDNVEITCVVSGHPQITSVSWNSIYQTAQSMSLMN